MKTYLIYGSRVLLVLLGIMLMNSTYASKDKSDEVEKSVLRHVVFFKFKAGTPQTEIDNLVTAFQKLPSQIHQIQSFEWGTDNSPEGLSKGFTHCFLVTFASEADRDAYLPHPVHKEFVAKLKPILDDVTVVDYWSKK